MGIRGLSSFINRYSDKYLEDYKLKDCQLIIDGSSLLSQIFMGSTNSNCAFGGDYNRYAVSVIDFFGLLKKCGVAPLVVFDGGYERQKFRTAFSRLRQKWRCAKHVTPVTQYRDKLFPCLLKEAFKDVLKELHVPFAQCLFEADEEIAAIAKCLKCPVLSYDSDFFVYDVLYIPFPTLHLYPRKDESASSSNVSYYLNCSLYRIDNFLRRCGGLQKDILPLFATMMGNDYVGNRALKHFVGQLKQHKARGANGKQRRIPALLKWLQSETLETATAKVMGLLKKGKRQQVAIQVRRMVALYMECSSELLPFLGIQDFNFEVDMSTEMNSVKQLLEQQFVVNDSCQGKADSENTDALNNDDRSSSCSSSEEEEEEEEGTEDNDISGMEDFENESEINRGPDGGEAKTYRLSEVEKASQLPKWFLEKFRQGIFPSGLMDMFAADHYFVPPQVEDFNCLSSHTISLPVISVIYGLMTGCERDRYLKCYIRKSCKRKLYTVVYPVLETASVKFPPLEHLPNLPLCQRMLILGETACLNNVDRQLIALLPLPWQLYVISVVFWANHCEQPGVDSSHVDALLLCMLLLDVGVNAVCLSSKKQGRRRNKVINKVNLCANDKTLFKQALSVDSYEPCDVLSKNAEHVILKNQLEVGDSCSQIISENDIIQDSTIYGQEKDVAELHKNLVSLSQSLETLNLQERILVKKILNPWAQMDEKLRTRPKLFCISTVHTFAQYQSCLLHLTYLNAVLDFPLPHCISFRVFCGTFVYNMYHNLKQRKNSLAYISQLLSTVPSILSLFTILREMVAKQIPEVPTTDRAKRKSSKKKQKSNSKNEDFEILEDEQHQFTDTEFEDPCNRFAALSVQL